MPRVKLHDCRGRMVTPHDDHIRLQSHQPWQAGVDCLDNLDLSLEISLLATSIGLLHMDVKEIKLVPVFFQGIEFILQGSARQGEYLHPHQAGNPAIHSIYRNSRCMQAVALLETRQHRQLGKAAQQDHVGG